MPILNRVSEAFAELQNIVNAAKDHKKHCQENCGVSLYMLGMTAKRLVDHCWLHEKAQARRIIAETEWS